MYNITGEVTVTDEILKNGDTLPSIKPHEVLVVALTRHGSQLLLIIVRGNTNMHIQKLHV